MWRASRSEHRLLAGCPRHPVCRSRPKLLRLRRRLSSGVRLFARIEKVFRVRWPLATLFEAPTIHELAEILRRQAPESGWSSLVAIQPKGSRPPFFCVHPHGGNVLVYRELSRHLGADQPFYGLQVLIALAAGTRPLWRNGWPIGSMILRY